jgi:hypothetical protein
MYPDIGPDASKTVKYTGIEKKAKVFTIPAEIHNRI